MICIIGQLFSYLNVLCFVDEDEDEADEPEDEDEFQEDEDLPEDEADTHDEL